MEKRKSTFAFFARHFFIDMISKVTLTVSLNWMFHEQASVIRVHEIVATNYE